MNHTTKCILLALCLSAVGSAELPRRYQVKTQTGGLSLYQQKLDARVERFDTSGRSLASTVLDLAYEREIPIAIEYLDTDAVYRPLSLEFRDQSVSEILVGIVQQVPQYRIAFSAGIVELYSPKARDDRANLLNKPIKDFAVTEVDTHKADSELFCSLTRELLPTGACGGSVALGQWGPQKITVHMQNARVYEILNAIVAENGKAVWTVIAPPAKLKEIPTGGLWHIYPLDSAYKDGVSEKIASIGL